jgi:hypothetical protein
MNNIEHYHFPDCLAEGISAEHIEILKELNE